MGFTFIETNLRAALHIGIQQPIDNKERSFDPSYFSKGDGQIMLSWMGGKLSTELTWRHYTSHHGGCAA
jgi:hypothetical protein